jgi:predicted hotdog family 3-hydroxylacyl-ACP dehydratase
MLVARAELMSLIPHQGGMCLLDGVLAWDDTRIRCVAGSHRDPANPLRRAGTLSSVHALEYGAQAMAAHGGLLARRAGSRLEGGFLAAARDVRLNVARLDEVAQPLIVEAERMLADGGNLIYGFRLLADQRELASGRVTVMTQRSGEQ